MKKIITLMTIVITFFTMTAISLAANTASMFVTSVPISWGTYCDKVGSVALGFDDQTLFESGDQITADLPLNVSLCRSFDFIIGIANTGDPNEYSEAFTLPSVGTSDQGPVTGDGSLSTPTGPGIAFHVYGTVGTRRIYIDIVSDSDGDGTLAVETAADSNLLFTASGTGQFVLKLFNQEAYNTVSGMWSQGATTTYDTRTTSAENTVCINISDYTPDPPYIALFFNSKEDKYTWIPSNPQIAHIVTGISLQSAPCPSHASGNIIGPSSANCPDFDNEAGSGTSNGATNADGYCVNTHKNNRVIIKEENGDEIPAVIYQIQLEIIVNDSGGDQGVYFSTGGVSTRGFSTSVESCSDITTDTTLTPAYYGPDGLPATPATTQTCSVAQENKVTKIITEGSNLGLNGTDEDYLWIDLPNFIYDSSLFLVGETIYVKVSILEPPCAVRYTGYWCIGTLGCETFPWEMFLPAMIKRQTY